MEKLIEFGRRAAFYVRVLSGYEERRIRSYRLQIQQRLAEAEERKSALKKIPEQVILPEVRRMVEEMQSLNKKLDETEMVKTMRRQAMIEKEEAEKFANVGDADAKQHIHHESSPNPADAKQHIHHESSPNPSGLAK